MGDLELRADLQGDAAVVDVALKDTTVRLDVASLSSAPPVVPVEGQRRPSLRMGNRA